MKDKTKVPEGKKLVFRRYRKCSKTDKVLDAFRYGKKAWPMLISCEKSKE